jgi:HSP20 family protein
MTIIRWYRNPDLERYFAGQAQSNPKSTLPTNSGALPDTNVKRLQDHYLIEMAAPGRVKENFAIKLENDTLTIGYQHQQAEPENGEKVKYLRREFVSGDFIRHFSLPETTDKEKIFARYEQGILSVKIPFDDPEKNKVSKIININ